MGRGFWRIPGGSSEEACRKNDSAFPTNWSETVGKTSEKMDIWILKKKQTLLSSLLRSRPKYVTVVLCSE